MNLNRSNKWNLEHRQIFQNGLATPKIMEVKKNPKVDLSRGSLLFFQIGLILILGLTYLAIEWKSYERKNIDIVQLDTDRQLEEEIPITEMNTPPPPPPPPPPAAPEVIEVVQNDIDIEETVIQSTETSQEEAIEKTVRIEDVSYEEPEETIEDVPFAVIENVPIYPGCEKQKGNEAKRKCMSEKIQAFVNKNFNNGLGADLGLTGLNRIYVRFKIDSKGNIVDIGARGPHPKLESEAERVVQMLPKMTPGNQRDKPVGVLYALPIIFEVREQ